MKFGSWNVHWLLPKDTDLVEKQRKKANKDKSKIIYEIIEKDNPDVFALLEAADADEDSEKIEGYTKIFSGRTHIHGFEKYQNGILLYAKDCYRAKICEEVFGEFIYNERACFLPVILNINEDENVHCLFVWATIKNGENGKSYPYGYNRFKIDIFDSGNFENTLKYINGENNNVVVMGDFNIVSNYSNNNPKAYQWNTVLGEMEKIGLKWVINEIPTCNDKVINDHCFVSKKLHPMSTVVVGDNRFGNVVSDHKMISLQVNFER